MRLCDIVQWGKAAWAIADLDAHTQVVVGPRIDGNGVVMFWEVRLLRNDGQLGNIWPHMAYNGIDEILRRELGMTLLNAPEWRIYA